MSPEEIANHASLVIEAMRDRSTQYKGFVHAMLLDPTVIAAAVSAHLASITAAQPVSARKVQL